MSLKLCVCEKQASWRRVEGGGRGKTTQTDSDT